MTAQQLVQGAPADAERLGVLHLVARGSLQGRWMHSISARAYASLKLPQPPRQLGIPEARARAHPLRVAAVLHEAARAEVLAVLHVGCAGGVRRGSGPRRGVLGQQEVAQAHDRVRADIPLDRLFRRLHLANAPRIYRDLAARAEREQWSYRDFLAVLVAEEVAHRQQTRVQRLSRRARFPFLKTIDEFDFTYQSTLRLALSSDSIR
jgi:hypothetical protein